MNPWSQTIEEVLTAVVSKAQGLSDAEAQSRLARDGLNALHAEKKVTAVVRFLNQFKSPVVLTLLGAAVISAIVGETVDAAAIAAILVINAIIAFVQEAKAEEAVAALKKMAAPHARVLRDGSIVEMPADQVAQGDILVLESGDFVPADARLISANQFTCKEAPLTGESLPVTKSLAPLKPETPLADRINMIFAGTTVENGSGKAVVTATGMGTEIGRIANLLSEAVLEETPLQKRLRLVGNRLLLFSGAVTALVAAFGLYHGQPGVEVLMSAVSLAVAAIPEGLPAVVTLSLALAVRRMTSRNAIVRHLPAVETLGTTDVICTDKTGTLTTGQMEVREIVTVKQIIAVTNPILSTDSQAQQLLTSAVLCSNASLATNGSSTGDTTEVAILKLAAENGISAATLNQSNLRVAEWAFDSVRKRMSVAVVVPDKGYRIEVKGAPESLLPLCRLSDPERKDIDEKLESLSAQGRRVLAVARRELQDIGEEGNRLSSSAVEQELSFLGLIAIADPPRQEAMRAVAACKEAGIKVVMITGDHPVTAKAIAIELGIVVLGQFEGVLTGTELDAKDDTQLFEAVLVTAVYARVSPEHKLRIVRAWKSHGCVVAMTGDGVNDAPALKEASIGISMGKGGTEVARQASSMVLADDNFATIVNAVEEGRGVHGNIQRTIQYLLSGNAGEILVMLGAAIVGWPAPLFPLHLLWINLVTDGIPTLALAAERVPADALKHKPSNRMGRNFYLRILFTGSLTASLTLGVYAYYLGEGDEVGARTMAFSMLVFAELFRSFASRSDTRTFFQLRPATNLYLLLAVGLPVLFQFYLHHSKTFRELFRVEMLTWSECFLLVGLALVPVTILEVAKLIAQKRAS